MELIINIGSNNNNHYNLFIQKRVSTLLKKKKELVPEHASIKKLENKPKEEENRDTKDDRVFCQKIKMMNEFILLFSSCDMYRGGSKNFFSVTEIYSDKKL